jgi:putative endonuclease
VRQFYVYILASHSRRLYVGFTNDLVRRVYEHTQGWCEFTARYAITRLVHCESFRHPMAGIHREKRLKKTPRQKKIELIETKNPGWIDLADGWFDSPD